MISAWTERSSSTSIGTGPSSRSAGVSRGWTSRVAIPVRGVSEADERQTQAHRLRAPRGARERPGRAVRRRRRSHRRLRAVLVVHGRDGHVPRRRGDGPCDRRGGKGRARRRAPPRDGLPGGATRRRHRGAAACTPIRGARVRRLPAPVKARLSTDGGARGNPGPAAFAYVLETEDGTVLAAHGEAIGVATNNVAEYRALVEGLRKAAELQVGEVEVVSDSELVVKQMRGEYKVKNEALRALSLEAARLGRQVGKVTYRAVRREHNELADQLVNEALDAAG